MIEPRVSVPIAKPTSPAAVAEPGPADDPLDPLLRVPRIVGLAAEPVVALRQRAHRELRDEDRAGVAQPLDDGGVVVEDLILKRAGAPRRRDALGREQVLRAPGDAVKRPSVSAGADLAIGLRRLRQREILGQRDDAVQLRPVLLQPIEVHLRQSVDETSRRWSSGASAVTGRKARSSIERPDAPAAGERRPSLRAGCGAGLRLLARKIGTEGDGRLGIERDVELAKLLEDARLRLTPAAACFSSASVKSTPKIFSAQSSVALSMRGACCCAAPAARLAPTAAGIAARKRRRATLRGRAMFRFTGIELSRSQRSIHSVTR